MEILKVLAWIEAVRKITGAWDVFYDSDVTEMDEDSALRMSDGKVTIASGGTLVATCKDGQQRHDLRGSVSFGNFRYTEIIKWNGKDVEKDDIYISSHLTDGENRYALVDFKFVQGGTRHWFRFKKSIQGV